MADEAEIGSAEAPDGGRRSRGSRGEPAPLQSRAHFLQNWSWASVTQINGGLCERGRAQRGINSEAHTAVAEEWEKRRASELTLLRRKEAASAVAHFITGVLDQELMIDAIDSLSQSSSFAPGDRVKTLRG